MFTLKKYYLVGILALVISTVFPVNLEASPVRAQTNGIDLVLTINGSGSISAADFALQKEGIKVALQNSQILPRNGSVAFALVQYANGITTVHIPYTLIDSEQDISSLVAQVNAVVQIQGLTNPGDGINTAMNVLNTNGDASREQIICLSTDGLPNAGADVATALNDAKSSTVALDRFSVIAIEDPPFFFEPDFQNFYGSLVFGGGAVTVTRNSTEYANILGATCLPSQLELVGLEANQAIQDLSDSVQLIEDKTTYVRAYIQTVDGAEHIALARLRGFRGGTELPGSPITAINPGGNITARPNALERRGNLADSLNFRLPSSWLNGTITLRVEGVGGGLECKDRADTPDDCIVEVTFNPTDQVEVIFVGVKWEENGTTHEPSPGDLSRLATRLRAIYPIASGTTGLDWETEQLTYVGPTPPNLSLLNLQLELRRLADLCFSILGCDRLYYANVVGAPQLGGLANGIPGTVASGDMGAEPYVHAHELGHLLGRRHATYCNASDSAAPTFPYTANIGGRTVATIGPMNSGDHRLIFGLDAQEMRVMSPRDNFELMSYCQPLWISDFTYNALRSAINDTFSSASFQQAGDPAQEYVVYRGVVDFEDNTVDFQPVSSIFSPVQAPMMPPGDYSLQLRDSSQNLINEIPFQPSEYHAFGAPDPGIGSFIIPVLKDSAVVEIAVLSGGEFLGSLSSSPNSPTVNVISPNGGEALSGPTLDIQWEAVDLDGDQLTYLVQYSRDGGGTWETLITDWPNENYTIDLGFLAKSNSGLIRVIASDGFNTAFDQSDNFFSTPNNLPTVSILSPNNDAQFIGVQPIFFDGIGDDQEDGMLSGINLVWISTLDGILGYGETFNLEATDLSEGEHTISLTAIDSEGSTATATVKIYVFRLSPVLNQHPSLIVPGDQEVQYSDSLSFLVSATDPNNASDTLTFSAVGLPSDLVLTNNGDGTATISGVASVAPNTYTTQITVTDPGGLTDTRSIDIVVIKEDARTTYTGPLMVSTGCATCSTATIPLRATIQDITAVLDDPSFDPDAGNITNATVSFVNRSNNSILCTSNVLLFGQANSTVGTATCNWTANIGPGYGMDYTIGTLVNGYYARNSTEDDVVLVVSKPTSNFITGGGSFLNTNSGGTYAGDPELKTNFGLNIKFTRKLTNLQGRVTIIVRQGDRVYQIKSTALSSIVAVPYSPSNTNSGTAELITKATVTDVTDPSHPITVAGNTILNIVMKDNGEPGSADLIGISLWSRDGQLLFSSNWDGRQTVKVTLNGGNLSIK